jgi:hypothetical protein
MFAALRAAPCTALAKDRNHESFTCQLPGVVPEHQQSGAQICGLPRHLPGIPDLLSLQSPRPLRPTPFSTSLGKSTFIRQFHPCQAQPIQPINSYTATLLLDTTSPVLDATHPVCVCFLLPHDRLEAVGWLCVLPLVRT